MNEKINALITIFSIFKMQSGLNCFFKFNEEMVVMNKNYYYYIADEKREIVETKKYNIKKL